MPEDTELARKHSENEISRSRVRQWVTYSVIWAYLALAATVTLWLMWAGRYEVAIGVLAGVAGLAGSITGFLVRVEASIGNERYCHFGWW